MDIRELVDKDLGDMIFHKKNNRRYYVDVVALLHFLNVICRNNTLPKESYIKMGNRPELARIQRLCGDHVELDNSAKWRSQLCVDRGKSREVLSIEVNKLGRMVIKVD